MFPLARITEIPFAKPTMNVYHLGTATDKYLRCSVDTHTIEKANNNRKCKECSCDLIIAPFIFYRANQDCRNRYDKTDQADQVLRC